MELSINVNDEIQKLPYFFAVELPLDQLVVQQSPLQK